MQAAMSRITFAPGVMEALQSSTPPTIALFKRLPVRSKGSQVLWAVYVIVLEKRNHRSKIYVGCGTDFRHGVKVRLQHYKPNSNKLPKLVKKAMGDGWSITHKGLLYWTDLPRPKKRFSSRSLFLILECVFALAFWAMASRTKTYCMPNLLSWDIESLDYDGCCTHTSLHEMIPGEEDGLSPEQVACKQEAAESRRKEQDKRARDKYYAQRNAEDFEGWRLRKNASLKKSDAKIKASGKYRCKPCGLTFKSQFALNKHKGRQSHKDTVGTGRVYKHPQEKLRADAAKAAKTHHCALCNRSLASTSALKKHTEGPRHRGKEAAASA